MQQDIPVSQGGSKQQCLLAIVLASSSSKQQYQSFTQARGSPEVLAGVLPEEVRHVIECGPSRAPEERPPVVVLHSEAPVGTHLSASPLAIVLVVAPPQGIPVPSFPSPPASFPPPPLPPFPLPSPSYLLKAVVVLILVVLVLILIQAQVIVAARPPVTAALLVGQQRIPRILEPCKERVLIFLLRPSYEDLRPNTIQDRQQLDSFAPSFQPSHCAT